jgi:hypothetical protein
MNTLILIIGFIIVIKIMWMIYELVDAIKCEVYKIYQMMWDEKNPRKYY